MLSSRLSRQTPYVPYYGKNRIRYNDFKWNIYKTDHFEIYYYPEIEPQLERVTSYAESAYQQVSSDLKHDLAFKVPLVLYKTQSEFQQQNIEPGELPEGVLAFAEPYRDRMVLPIDEPSDALYRLITHELTHIFEFDIIPRSLLHRSLPLWVDEGLSDYMTGYWQPFDLMSVRDAAIADIVPSMSDFRGRGVRRRPAALQPRSRGVRVHRIALGQGRPAAVPLRAAQGRDRRRRERVRRSVQTEAGGVRRAVREVSEGSVQAVPRQGAAGRLRPRSRAQARQDARTPSVVSIEPSPTGDLMAVAAGNRKDQELDIVLMSTKDGKVDSQPDRAASTRIAATNTSRRPAGFRNNAVSWMSWAPAGDRIALLRAHREEQDARSSRTSSRSKIEKRHRAQDAWTVPSRPTSARTAREVAFAALRGAVADIFIVNLESGEIRERHQRRTSATTRRPTRPTASRCIYLARVSGNDKLFRLDLASGKKTQLTFGTHDDGGAQFIDDDTIVFPSTAVDPNQPIDPEVARNGNIYNIWTLNLKNGELKQYTDTLTGNVSPIVLRDQKPAKIAFVTYYKGEYGIHTLPRDEAACTPCASADFGSPGPIIDFTPPISRTRSCKSNIHKKGTFEKLFLEGRPPVAVGVTSGGDLFGGTQVTFSDVLGDKQFSMFASSVVAVPDDVVLVY